MKVTFRREDDRAKRSIDVSPESKIAEGCNVAQMLLGLPEDSNYQIILSSSNTKIKDWLSFKEAGVKENDELVLVLNSDNSAFKDTAPVENSSRRKAKNTSEAFQANSVSLLSGLDKSKESHSGLTSSSTALGRNIREDNSRDEKSNSKSWQKASIGGGLFGLLVIAGLLLVNQDSNTSVSDTADAAVSNNNITDNSEGITREGDSGDVPRPDGISQEDALSLVNSWLNAKERMNAPPYDRQILQQVATGKQYENALGTIDWLQANNARYAYNFQRIDRLENFYSTEREAKIQVIVVEDLVLYMNGNINSQRSGLKTTNVTYTLSMVNGTWKISSADVLN